MQAGLCREVKMPTTSSVVKLFLDWNNPKTAYCLICINRADQLLTSNDRRCVSSWPKWVFLWEQTRGNPRYLVLPSSVISIPDPSRSPTLLTWLAATTLLHPIPSSATLFSWIVSFPPSFKWGVGNRVMGNQSRGNITSGAVDPSSPTPLSPLLPSILSRP